MKLYISYYGNSLSMVEGKYNSKKDTYTIKNYMFLSDKDIDIDYNDKYSLLKEALNRYEWKSKDVVLCLNTKDVIIKSNSTYKVSPKDLDGIMNNEMDEMMSLDLEDYTFSYEVTKESKVDNKESLDLIIAAIRNEEIESILDIFKEYKMNLIRVDTMSTAYGRLLKKIEYDNIMALNIGSYGSLVNIFKEDTLFIHDNIPIRINENSNDLVYGELVEEVRGLMNFYSSRNYGNPVDTILLIGEEGENEEVVRNFRNNFSTNIVSGIENLFDIEEDIIGEIYTDEISKICELLGTMSVSEDRKGYLPMNLLPHKYKKKINKAFSMKQCLKAAPVALVIVFAPYVIFAAMEMSNNDKIDKAQEELNAILEDYKEVEVINEQIKSSQDELGVYDMLLSKKIKWGDILTMIDNNIPYKADLTNVNVYYDSQLGKEDDTDAENSTGIQEGNENSEEQDGSTEETAEEGTPIYDQIPNTIVIDGEAKDTSYVGQFVYNLNKIPLFESVELKNTTEDKEKGIHTFNIVIVLKEGVVHVR